MPNFSIGTQIKKELDDFKKPIRLTYQQRDDGEAVRFASAKRSTYDHNVRDTINIIDLYWNSQFESGAYDNNGQRKFFLNTGKFRTEVSSKQIAIATKDGRFIPTDFADPFVAFFMQKDFHEWAKESDLADLINTWEDKFPRYGTIVGKQLGLDIVDLPLQNIEAMDQSAISIQESSHFIEGHPGMRSWEIQAMPDWNTNGITLRFDEEYHVYERCGYVPAEWYHRQNGTEDAEAKKDSGKYIDVRVIGFWPTNDKKKDFHVFFVERTYGDRGYREAHWSRQHGRWLGYGVMEDQLENQRAKNVTVNAVRRSIQWASKRVMQSGSSDMAAKSLVRDVKDGEILDVGVNGEIKPVILESKTGTDVSVLTQEFERNSDQKAFTYEVATGEKAGGMTATVGVILSKAVNTYFSKKREAYGLFLKKIIIDFKVPQFYKDMDNQARVLTLFSDEAGYEVLKDAAMQWVRSEACRIGIMTGKPIDAQTLAQAVQPYEAASMLFGNKPKGAYKNSGSKFDLEFTGESVDLQEKLQSLNALYQMLAMRQDPRAEGVLARIATLGGESMASFGPKGTPAPATPSAPAQPAMPQLTPAAA